MTAPASGAAPEPDWTIALTGAGGFIGSHVAHRLLRDGRRVRALVRYGSSGSAGHMEEVLRLGREADEPWVSANRLEIVRGDVLDERCVRELVRDCDQVVHMAALIGIPYSYAAPGSYVRVNIQGTLNVLEACREECPERVILTSTSEVYGTAREVPIRESHPLRAQSPYAASKIAADKLGEAYHRSFGLPVVTLRPFNTYGPRQSARAVIPAILAQALSVRCDSIRLGALETSRDLTFVEDTAAAFAAAVRAPLAPLAGRTLNVGTGREWTIAQIAEKALAAVNASKPLVADPDRIRPAASEVERLVADASRFKAKTGWEPKTELETGLERTAKWIEERLDRFHPLEYRI